MSDIGNNKDLVCRFNGAVNARDWSALDRLVASSFVRHSSAAPPVNSRDELKAFLRAESETFPDAEETIEDMVAEGDKIAVRHTFRGTQRGPMGPYPPSGRRLEASYLAIYRIADGRIAEAWVEWDNLSGLSQLGHLETRE